MSTKAIKRRRDEGPLAGDWQAPREVAPSVMRSEEPRAARALGLFGLLLTVLGAMALIMAAWSAAHGTTPRLLAAMLGTGWGTFVLALGQAGMLFHAFSEKDQQLRRLYGALGTALFIAGAAFALIPFAGQVGGQFMPVGAPCLALALLYLLSFTRNETDEHVLNLTVNLLGVAGAVAVVVGIIGSLVNDTFLLGMGLVLLVLGLLYVAAYVARQPAGSDRGYWAGIGIGVAGAVLLVIGVGYWLWPSTVGRWTGTEGLFAWPGWTRGQPAPAFLFIYLGIEYVLLSVGTCSDRPLVVLTRRELAAFFYSPVAYIVLIAFTLLGWLSYVSFLAQVLQASAGGGLPEPIVIRFGLSLMSVISILVAVPVLTMRLISEEKRTGTLEMLLTAPVNEGAVVVAKFLAALRFFLLVWYLWGVYFIALRLQGGEEFDYRPLLSFAIILLFTGASLLSMGVFFSSLTRSQIAAAVLTFMGVGALFVVYFVRELLLQTGTWSNVLEYVSFIDLWIHSLYGTIAPRFLLFHLSATIFWLFLAVKVLEARKWS